MSKFLDKYKHYSTMYCENSIPWQALNIRAGEQVKIKEDIFKHEYCKDLENTSTGQRIRDLFNTEKPIIVYDIKSKSQSNYGSFGADKETTINNENEWFVTVGEQYAPGLYRNIVDIPLGCVERVDLGINLPIPSASSDPKRQTTGEEFKGNEITDYTHRAWKDHGGPKPSKSYSYTEK